MSKNIKLESFKKYIKGRRAAVIGVGISNKPLIKWLYKLGADVTAFDKLGENDPAMLATRAELRECGVSVSWVCGDDYLSHLSDDNYDIVFKTPKMRVETPELQEAVSKGSILTNEMELFMALCPGEIFAITGSDGKTTTTTLVSEILKKGGYKVWLGGNIGTPLLEFVEEMSEDDKIVLELSSFQLLNMAQSADVAIVTNVTPNHLDFHKDYDEYIASKTNVFKHQNAMGKVILNSSYDITYNMKDLARGRVTFFAQERCEDEGIFGKAYLDGSVLVYECDGVITPIIGESEIFIPGKHNVENYLAAISATFDYVTVEDIQFVARNFTGVPHRIEFVRELDGVRYYNSSIDTSPNRTLNTMKALAARKEKGVLIAGGADKKCIYTGLGDAILNVCDRIVLYGSNADLVSNIIAEEANGRKYTLVTLESVEGEVYEFPETKDAVEKKFIEAIDKARDLANPGELIIMSNIGTSYDHFRHFEHRGDLFKDLVNRLS